MLIVAMLIKKNECTLISLLSIKNGFNKVQKNISREEATNIKNFTG